MLSASVTVDKQLVSSIGRGVLVFAAVGPGDTEQEADSLASKVLKMRMWDGDTGARVQDLDASEIETHLMARVVEEERPRY